MTDAEHVSFDQRCHFSDACAMEDNTLRGSSPYSSEATVKWQQFQPAKKRPLVPFLIVLICSVVTFVVLVNTLMRRIPWNGMKLPKFIRERNRHSFHRPNSAGLTSQDAFYNPETASQTPSGAQRSELSLGPTPCMTPLPLRGQSSQDLLIRMSAVSPDTSVDALGYKSGVERTPHQQSQSDGIPIARNFENDLYFGLNTPPRNSTEQSKESFQGQGSNPIVTVTPVSEPLSGVNMDSIDRDVVRHNTPLALSPLRNEFNEKASSHDGHASYSQKASSDERSAIYSLYEKLAYEDAGAEALVAKETVPQTQPGGNLPAGRRRLDYLAGLVALSSILVTAIHFTLTFIPSAIDPDAYAHYESENWARKTVGSYFLNLVWIGPFLMTSTRFLTSGYLRNGDLRHIAEKTVGRPFRLLIPIVAIAMLEYFLMDSGAVTWLEYLPSVTWSTLPFAYVPNNFGHFISEILELGYLIPNAAPRIIFNYCTGVLWTIPVQLQGSWLTLLGVIVIREIKTPWKRFSYYTFCILMHWYAISWGTYFYVGILLADLDVTYHYRKYLYARPLVYFPLIAVCAMAAFGGLTIDALTQWTGVNYSAWEYGVHPDPPTGKPIMLTGAAGYPEYFVPKLNGFVFATGLQALVELSPVMQRVFSFKLLTYVFPHIFTIYLIHGFIFYSLGACVCTYLSAHNFPYWLNLLVVAICCYATLGLSLPLLTPVVETLGKNVTRTMWQFASEEPAPRHPTLFPFDTEVLFVRPIDANDDGIGEVGMEDAEVGGKKLSHD